MNDLELEHAAMAPLRWNKLCAAFQKQHLNDPCAKVRPRTTRIIDDSLAADHPESFVVPGGRYMVSFSPNGIFVWDLGYTSSADCKLITSVGPEGGSYECMVQATPDGMGLVILSSHPNEGYSVYEIYPQSETPQLTQIAHLDPYTNPHVYLLPDRLIWRLCYADRIMFRVWDYRVNHSITFSANVDVEKFEYNVEVMATKTAIIVLCGEGILVWAIPPLLPQPPALFDHSLPHIPLLRIPFPDGIVNHDDVAWQTISHWYCGSLKPLYFDIFCRDSKLHRFKIIIKPDLFDTSLHLINTELVPDDFYDISFQGYSICEDALVACWEGKYQNQFGAYTGLMSSRSTPSISYGGPATKMLLPLTPSGYSFFSLCPASGRYVHLDNDIGKIIVVDLF